MSNVTYIKDDLFNAPKDLFLGHACNCQGVWGSGIALQFARRFDDEFHAYKNFCYRRITLNPNNTSALGKAFVINRIVCFFTSFDFGNKVDSLEDILKNTKSSLQNLLDNTPIRKLAIPKINSGLFKIPWEETEKILLQFPEIEFIVYEDK